MYELFVKLFHISYAAIISFTPVTLDHNNQALHIQSMLTAPVTHEVEELIKSNYRFKVKKELTLIVNQKHVINREVIHTLSYDNGYRVNNSKVDHNDVQQAMGAVDILIPHVRFDEGDSLLLLLKARIVVDSNFTRSTGLATGVLWNYYVPRTEHQLHFTKGRFVYNEH
ncbi:MAG: hypothetical protein OCD01_04535 [Fibrobacterales bacterium]